MELGSVEATKELVGAGLGCGVVPRVAIRRTLERESACIRSIPGFSESSQSFCVTINPFRKRFERS
jgi:DNA-binding transcriptional LysR family regulator